MLRRRSTRHRQHRPLVRSKSAHPVVRNPIEGLESVDPVIAKRDAHTAAILSYHRAQGGNLPMDHYPQSENDAILDGPSRRRLTDRSLAVDSEAYSQHSDAIPPPSLKPQRRQSVRLSGPKARLTRDLAPRARKARTSSSGQNGGSETTTQGQTLKSIAQIHGKGFGFHSLTRSYLRSMKASEAETSALPDDIHSQPGPGKLRKSRSMFTAVDADKNSYFFSNSTPPPPLAAAGQVRRSRSRFAALNTDPMVPDKTLGTHEASYPFGGEHEGKHHTSSQPAKDLAVQLARKMFQQQIERQDRQKHNQSSLRPQSSRFFRSRNQRSESSRALRKSFRNSSHTSAEISSAFSGQSVSMPKQAGLRNTARRVSQSLRSRLKGLMTRPGLEMESFQSLGHDADIPRESDLGSEAADDQVGEASMSQVASHIPSLHAVPSYQQMKSRKGSVESLDTVDGPSADDRSRVTSWTNSITNTLPSQSAAGEWERQRLSVIKENGMHVSSSSLPRPAAGFSPQAIVSSDRVYAALMKRLEDSQGRDGQQRHQNVDSLTIADAVPPRSSSVGPYEAPTIRCVAAEDDVFTDKKENQSARESYTEPICGATGARDGTHGSCQDPLDKASHASPQSAKSKTISHRSSAFFGSPSTHLFRTTSPYRKALHQEMNKSEYSKAEQLSSSQYLNTLSPLVLPPKRPSSVTSGCSKAKASDASLYSCHDAETGGQLFSEVADAMPHLQSSLEIGGSPAGQRSASTASSVEWKKWLSADVARSQDSMKKVFPSGHIREQAEIESPDDRRGCNVARLASTSDTTPLRVIASNPRSSSAQKVQRDSSGGVAQKSENHRPTPLSTPTDPSHRGATVSSGVTPRAFPTYHSMSTGRAGDLNIDVPEEWPLTDPDKLWAARGRVRPSSQHMRPPLSHIITSSGDTSLGKEGREDEMKVDAASVGRLSSWDLDKTLHRLHIGGNDGISTNGHTELSCSKGDPRVRGSKRMVDLFLSSRRRKGSSKRSRSTSDGSPAFL